MTSRENLRVPDQGLTLIELLVTVTIMSIVGVLAFGATVMAQRAQATSQLANDLNEEARLALNRISRELREAKAVTAVANPMGPDHTIANDVEFTFEVDFNGNGTIEPTAADPERLTYRYDADSKRLLLVASATEYPVLAANVEEFRVNFTSRLWPYDGTNASPAAGTCGTQTAPADGIVDWWEVDGHPSAQRGNCNRLLDVELDAIDSVFIEVKVLDGNRQQTYRTQVDLRNVNP